MLDARVLTLHSERAHRLLMHSFLAHHVLLRRAVISGGIVVRHLAPSLDAIHAHHERGLMVPLKTLLFFRLP